MRGRCSRRLVPLTTKGQIVRTGTGLRGNSRQQRSRQIMRHKRQKREAHKEVYSNSTRDTRLCEYMQQLARRWMIFCPRLTVSKRKNRSRVYILNCLCSAVGSSQAPQPAMISSCRGRARSSCSAVSRTIHLSATATQAYGSSFFAQRNVIAQKIKEREGTDGASKQTTKKKGTTKHTGRSS